MNLLEILTTAEKIGAHLSRVRPQSQQENADFTANCLLTLARFMPEIQLNQSLETQFAQKIVESMSAIYLTVPESQPYVAFRQTLSELGILLSKEAPTVQIHDNDKSCLLAADKQADRHEESSKLEHQGL